jgi:concanavalin A-like lectin/glucanase superfamily protein
VALKDSLVFYCKMDAASGNETDVIGGRTLTETSGTIPSVAGRVNAARDFEAGDTEYFTVADDAGLSMGNIDFTLAAWVNLESKAADQTILGKWAGTPGSEYILQYLTGIDRFIFAVSDNGSYLTHFAQVNANAHGSVSTATWLHVVAWHDATANVIAIAVNGGSSSTTSWSTGVFDGVSNFTIGRNDEGGIQYFDGLIDEVAVWKRVLSLAERQQLYNGGGGLPLEAWDAVYPSPVRVGPPVPGAPWTQFMRPPLTRAIPSPTELTPDVVSPPQNYPQPVRVGPPVPGAPWTQFFRLPFPRPVADNTPPSPPTPVGPGRGKSRPYIARIPRNLKGRINERRQARTSEQLHYIINALITRGELRQFGPSSWQLVSGGHTAERDPANNDDVASGFVVGATWVNTVSDQVFMCVDNSLTNAIWKQVSV